MSIYTRLAEKSEHDIWDNIIQSSPQGSIFHQWRWLQIAAEECHAELHPLFFYNNETIIGLLPLFLQKKGGMQLISSPSIHSAIPYLGVVFHEFEQFKQHKREHFYQEIQKCADSYITDNFAASYISLLLSPQLPDTRPFGWSGYSIEPRYDYIVDTTKGVKKVCENLDRKLRMDIKRGISRGIEISQGKKPELEKIYDIMVQRYHEQNRSVHVPLPYLSRLYDNFSENFKIFCAYYEGSLVSGHINIQWKDEIFLWIGNPKRSLTVTPSPNDLCGWSGLKYACEQNLKNFVFIGAAGNQRIHSYYAKFNPELRIRYSVQKTSGIARMMQYSYKFLFKPIYEKIHILSKNSEMNADDI